MAAPQKQTPPASARAAALALLEQVLGARRALDDVFDRTVDGLEPRDRAFARALAATVLRRLGEIDAVLDRLLDKPLPRKAVHVRHALRLGVAQLLFLETPAHAAVDGAVALAGRNRAFRGLVNAVLRRLVRERESLTAGLDPATLNTPPWLWAMLAEAYGEETARTIAQAHLTEAPLDITVKSDAEVWAEKLEATLLPTGSLRRPAGGNVEALPGYDDGAWWVQDAAAALPARLLLSGLEESAKDLAVLDLCAAPGGKTAQLAAAGARVTALDRSENRMKRLTANLARLGLAAEQVVADAEAFTPTAPFAVVLLDAPCSATGTIRRHPEVAHLRTPQDIAKLGGVQDRLLQAASRLVAPGGVLVYCTCSLLPGEGEQRIAAFLRENVQFARQPIAPNDVGGFAELITADGDLRTLPSHLAGLGGLDGFYACRLRRA
jgi:16S rRNA (cytosine967-C5)-methyltransferase